MTRKQQAAQKLAEAFSPREQIIIHDTTRAAMLRAADIIDKLTESDVLALQAKMLANGVSLEKVAKIDRAGIAAAHFRICAKDIADEKESHV